MSALSPTLASDPHVRRRGIGGSDIAAILGADPYGRVPNDVYLEQLGLASPRVFTPEQIDALEAGELLEDDIITMFTRRTGLQVVTGCETLVHPKYSFMVGNIDGRILGAPEGLEAKTTSFMNGIRNWNVEDAEDLPINVTTQTQWYMAVADGAFERFHVPVLIGGQRPKFFVVERDVEFGNMLIATVLKFWSEHVIPRVPPPPVNFDEVRRRWPKPVPSSPIAADLATVAAFHELLAAQAAKKAAEAREDAAKDIIAAYMADHDVLIIGDDIAITFKTQERAGFTVAPSSSRVMRINRKAFKS